MFVNGKSDSDFLELVHLHLLNCVEIGDFIHSRKFHWKFLPYVANQVEERTNSFLRSKLPQTGFRPCGKVSADEATHKHRTRQFVSFFTVVPESKSLVYSKFSDLAVVQAHRGSDIKESIVNVLTQQT